MLINHKKWLSSNCHNTYGKFTYHFSIQISMEQLMQIQTSIIVLNINSTFQTFFNFQFSSTFKFFQPLGSSNYHFISAPCFMTSSFPNERPHPTVRKSYWHFSTANWLDSRLQFFDFPWNNYCFRRRMPSEQDFLWHSVHSIYFLFP